MNVWVSLQVDDFQVGEYVRGIITKLNVEEQKVIITLKAPSDIKSDVILVSSYSMFNNNDCHETLKYNWVLMLLQLVCMCCDLAGSVGSWQY